MFVNSSERPKHTQYMGQTRPEFGVWTPMFSQNVCGLDRVFGPTTPTKPPESGHLVGFQGFARRFAEDLGKISRVFDPVPKPDQTPPGRSGYFCPRFSPVPDRALDARLRLSVVESGSLSQKPQRGPLRAAQRASMDGRTPFSPLTLDSPEGGGYKKTMTCTRGDDPDRNGRPYTRESS